MMPVLRLSLTVCRALPPKKGKGVDLGCHARATAARRTYADLARHYRTAIVPAQPYRPRDEAKVEVGLPRAAGIALFWLSSACPSRR